MIGRYEAYMNRIALSSIDPSILVLDIRPLDVQQQVSTTSVYGRQGARVNRVDVAKSAVQVQFEIHEYDTRKRQAICQKVQKWARSGVLEVTERPGQRLYAVCESLPVANAKAWTEVLTMTFAGYNPPFWEEINPTTISFSAAGSNSVFVPGNAPEALVSATITCGGSVSSLTITAGSTSITLNNLGASSGDVISVGYDANRILYIKKNNTSIMTKRSGTSSDDLVVDCGQLNTFAISTSGTITATMTVRGCWY